MLLLAANIAGWFVVSIFLTLYNKLSVTTWGMDFPLTITCFHLVMRMPMAAAAMRYLGVRAARFSWRELFVSVFPVSVMIALDIGLSNMAFMYVSVTYYTIVKSSVPMWVLCFSVLLGLQRFSLSLGATVLFIVVGIALASVDRADETEELPGTHAVVVGHGLEVVAEHAERVGRRLLRGLLLGVQPYAGMSSAMAPPPPPGAPPARHPTPRPSASRSCWWRPCAPGCVGR